MRRFATVLCLGATFACDPGANPPPAPVAGPGAGELPDVDHQDSMGEVGVPSDEELCLHLVEVAHRELGHLGELDARVETEALAECAAQVAEDRASYGIAFAPLAECTYAADSLAGIAGCEDHYAADLVGPGPDSTASTERLALERPIVDSELCSHRATLPTPAVASPSPSTAAAETPYDCRATLAELRTRAGNVTFDAAAWCMMDANTIAAFDRCGEGLEPRPPAGLTAVPTPGEADAAPTASEALAALGVITQAACGCKSVACAATERARLDEWTREHRAVGGTPDDARAAERLTARFVACERAVAGADWVSAPAPESKSTAAPD